MIRCVMRRAAAARVFHDARVTDGGRGCEGPVFDVLTRGHLEALRLLPVGKNQPTAPAANRACHSTPVDRGRRTRSASTPWPQRQPTAENSDFLVCCRVVHDGLVEVDVFGPRWNGSPALFHVKRRRSQRVGSTPLHPATRSQALACRSVGGRPGLSLLRPMDGIGKALGLAISTLPMYGWAAFHVKLVHAASGRRRGVCAATGSVGVVIWSVRSPLMQARS